MKKASVLAYAAVLSITLLSEISAKKQYQPSEQVLNQMMEIELERYQQKFNSEEKT